MLIPEISIPQFCLKQMPSVLSRSLFFRVHHSQRFNMLPVRAIRGSPERRTAGYEAYCKSWKEKGVELRSFYLSNASSSRKKLICPQNMLEVIVYRRLFNGIYLFIKFNAYKIHTAYLSDIDTFTQNGFSSHQAMSRNKRNFN